MEENDYQAYLSSAARLMRPNAIRALSKYVNRSDVISFAGGYPSPETFPIEAISEITAQLIRNHGASVLQYGLTRGSEEFRQYLKETLPSVLGPVEFDQLQITTGSQQGLDLVCRVLIDPGDVAFLELPSYIGAMSCIHNIGAEMVGVRLQNDGIDIDHLKEQIAETKRAGKRAKLIYTVSNFQNPAGVTMSIKKRQEILKVAAENDLLIVEDDPYGDIHFYDEHLNNPERPPELLPIRYYDEIGDKTGRVVYLGSFSKVLVPGIRSGYVVAPLPLARKLEYAKEAADVCSGILDQAIANEACRQGLVKTRLPKVRQFYRDRCKTMLDALGENAAPNTTWIKPDGGLFVWVELAEGIDAGELLKQTVENGVVFVPGQPFFVNGEGENTLRLAFSKETPERIVEGIRRLCQSI